MKQNRENPFFETYRTPFGTPPFDQIETEHYPVEQIQEYRHQPSAGTQ